VCASYLCCPRSDLQCRWLVLTTRHGRHCMALKAASLVASQLARLGSFLVLSISQATARMQRTNLSVWTNDAVCMQFVVSPLAMFCSGAVVISSDSLTNDGASLGNPLNIRWPSLLGCFHVYTISIRARPSTHSSALYFAGETHRFDLRSASRAETSSDRTSKPWFKPTMLLLLSSLCY
jgi:hypothetical protein